MEEEKAFLAHFLDEEIYIIDEVASVQETSVKQPVNTEPIIQEVAKEVPAKDTAREPKLEYQTPKVEKEISPAVSLIYEGRNDKGILLILNDISTEEKAFLEKVLGAVKLTLNDCAMLELSKNNSTEHKALIEEFKCKTILNLGVEQQLPFLQGINNYKINFVADKKALKTDNLKAIMADVAKKKQLWESLKQLFLLE